MRTLLKATGSAPGSPLLPARNKTNTPVQPAKTPDTNTADQELLKFRQLQTHLQQKKQGIKTGVLRKRTMRPDKTAEFDLSRYQKQMDKVIKVQRLIRSWVRVHRFRELGTVSFIACGYFRAIDTVASSF